MTDSCDLSLSNVHLLIILLLVPVLPQLQLLHAVPNKDEIIIDENDGFTIVLCP